MKIQVIDIKTNKLITDANADDVKILPRRGEIIPLNSGVYLVEGIAHMWDVALIKIMVKTVSENKEE